MSDIRTRLGAGVRALRRARGWTQEQLAERASLSYKFLGEIERGQGNPSVETLGRLGVALEVDVVDLFGFPATRKGVFELNKYDVFRVREALHSADQLLDRASRATRVAPVTRKPK